MKTQMLSAAIIAAVMSVGAAYAADAMAPKTEMAAPAAAAAAAPEKCYGVAKEGKDVAIELPAGICEKLENGTLTAPMAEPAKMEEKKEDKK